MDAFPAAPLSTTTMRKHVLVYTDATEAEAAGRFHHKLVVGLVSKGFRVTCVQPETSDASTQERESLGVRQIRMPYDPHKDFSRTMTDLAEPRHIFETTRADLVVFVDRFSISNMAARHVAIGRELPFIVVAGETPESLQQVFGRFLGTAEFQYKKAVAVLALSVAARNSLTFLNRDPVMPAHPEAAYEAGTQVVCGAVAALPSHRTQEIIAPAPHFSTDAAADTLVAIPTCNRPEMLWTALDSVRQQTARHRIRQVLISENSVTGGTADVCAEFASELPILHVLRRPMLTAAEHLQHLVCVESAAAPYFAMLHDDDWWAPEHLERSLEALESNHALACYSSFFDVSAEASALQCDDNVMFWMGAGYPQMLKPWVLDYRNTLLSSISVTPGRYSTLVARAAAFAGCAPVFANPFCNDRELTVAIAERGPIVYRPQPSAYIRMHLQQDGRQYTTNKGAQHMLETTLCVLKRAQSIGFDLPRALGDRIAAAPVQHLPVILMRLNMAWTRLALKDQPGLPAVLQQLWKPKQPATTEKIPA